MKKRQSSRGRKYGSGAKRSVASATRRQKAGTLKAGKGAAPAGQEPEAGDRHWPVGGA